MNDIMVRDQIYIDAETLKAFLPYKSSLFEHIDYKA